MYRIALVNMPFASVGLPSIALTQLKSVVENAPDLKVSVDVIYLNIEYAEQLGLDLYSTIADSVEAVTSGLGDWFFRPYAFPELVDNPEEYFTHHFVEQRQAMSTFHQPLLEARSNAGDQLEQLIAEHRLTEYDLVGMTSMFSQNVACFSLAKALKAQKPSLVTVLGGANCETPMGQVIVRNVEAIDFVASGPSLKSFVELVRCLEAKDSQACHEISGIFSRERLARHGDLHEVGDELDIDVDVDLEFDGFMDSLEKTFAGQIEPSLPFETSRGCWWGERSHCTFCGLNGLTMQYRAMDSEKARNLLHGLFERYGKTVKSFQSVDNILPRNYLTEVLPNLAPPPEASLFYEVKADLKDHELETLANARVNRIQPGIEALSTATLKLMRKGTTSFQNLRFLKSCLIYDIEPLWNLLIGFPNEPEETYRKYVADLPLLVHLPPPSGVYPVRFDRYSPYYQNAEDYNLELSAALFYRLIYPFPEDDIAQMAYFFADKNPDAPYLLGSAKWIGKLKQRIDHWHTRFLTKDDGLAPRLEWISNHVVLDTRSGKRLEHRLDRTSAEILHKCTRPTSTARLAKRFDTIKPKALERHILMLKGRGLIFREGDLFMSLVIEPIASDSRGRPLPGVELQPKNPSHLGDNGAPRPALARAVQDSP